MALANPAAQDRRPSSTSNNLSFASNNPFRNRATSPSETAPPPRIPTSFSAQPATRTSAVSKNPFLDDSEISNTPARPVNQDAVELASDIFGGLSIDTKTPQDRGPPPRHNVRPPRLAGPPAPRPDRPVRPARDAHSPLKGDARRPRGLSESSVQGVRERDRRDRDGERRPDRPPRTESEERRRRERRKEREERHRREKESGKKESRSSRRPQGLDLIDKLDVTGIYGQGLFHHDGPFDACNPHRNKKSHRAPMQAFPEGSANMALGGSGPINTHLDLDRFHGRGVESFSEYAGARKSDMNIINPTDRTAQVHGNETYGLGTSTFLEGAPAPRSAMQRRDSQDPNDVGSSGLTRKKSLAQRFRARGFSNSRPQNAELRSPEGRYNSASDDSPPQVKASSAGGIARARYNRDNEIDPFDKDYRKANAHRGQVKEVDGDKNGGSVTWANEVNAAHGSSALVRSVTADELPTNTRPLSRDDGDRSSGGSTAGGGGFINRMRSIRGGRRSRPEGKA